MNKGSGRLFRWQVLTLFLMAIGYTGYYFCRSNFSLVLPNIIADLTAQGMSVADAKIKLGLVASISVLGYAIAKFLMGPLSEILGGRRGFLIGMLGSVAFTIFFTFSGSLPLFTLTAIGGRLFQSMGWVNMVKISSRWFSYSTYGTAMGFLSLSFLFGDALARKTLSFVIGLGYNWREIYWCSAGILFVIFIVNFFFLKETPTEIGEEEPPANASNLVEGDASNPNLQISKIVKILLSNKIFVLICLLSLGTTIVRETFNTWTTTYFSEHLGFSHVEASSNSAWFPFFGGLSVLLAGFGSDRLGTNGRAAIMSYSLFLSTLLLLLLAHFDFGQTRYWHVFVVALVAFTLLGPYSYLGGAIALDLGGKKGSAIACGIIDGVGYLGGFLAGGSIAKISVVFGWKGAFTALAGITLLSFLGALFFLFEQRRVTAQSFDKSAFEPSLELNSKKS